MASTSHSPVGARTAAGLAAAAILLAGLAAGTANGAQ